MKRLSGNLARSGVVAVMLALMLQVASACPIPVHPGHGAPNAASLAGDTHPAPTTAGCHLAPAAKGQGVTLRIVAGHQPVPPLTASAWGGRPRWVAVSSTTVSAGELPATSTYLTTSRLRL